MAAKVSIIGAAGTIGSCAAFKIAGLGVVEELVMIDRNLNHLKGHVMDLQTAMTGTRDVRILAGSDENLSGSDIVIMAASTPFRPVTARIERLQENVPIVREAAEKIARYCPGAVVITATNPVDPFNLAMSLIVGTDRERFLGYSLNDSLRFRQMAAVCLGVEATRVRGMVIGEHGEHHVPLFSTLQVDGRPVSAGSELIETVETEMSRVLRTYIGLGTGRTTGWTTAMGLSTMVSAVLQDTGEVFPCSAVLAGEYGCAGLSITVPASLGRKGVRKVVELELPNEERVRLDHAVAHLQEVSFTLKQALKTH